ncbi:hypothetical protein M231_02996 [Tremella mesenterica]|uniref:Uncharacterized protein n=1 Tax=Tremella mesenterica TaxID=5217 RepID=A0A4Q1BPK0_TREME|nr:hypothetical protein M231_02996 [Tremella mesenterica]
MPSSLLKPHPSLPFFPKEILLFIVQELEMSSSRATLASLALTSKNSYDLVIPYLYRTYTLSLPLVTQHSPSDFNPNLPARFPHLPHYSFLPTWLYQLVICGNIPVRMTMALRCVETLVVYVEELGDGMSINLPETHWEGTVMPKLDRIVVAYRPDIFLEEDEGDIHGGVEGEGEEENHEEDEEDEEDEKDEENAEDAEDAEDEQDDEDEDDEEDEDDDEDEEQGYDSEDYDCLPLSQVIPLFGKPKHLCIRYPLIPSGHLTLPRLPILPSDQETCSDFHSNSFEHLSNLHGIDTLESLTFHDCSIQPFDTNIYIPHDEMLNIRIGFTKQVNPLSVQNDDDNPANVEKHRQEVTRYMIKRIRHVVECLELIFGDPYLFDGVTEDVSKYDNLFIIIFNPLGHLSPLGPYADKFPRFSDEVFFEIAVMRQFIERNDDSDAQFRQHIDGFLARVRFVKDDDQIFEEPCEACGGPV